MSRLPWADLYLLLVIAFALFASACGVAAGVGVAVALPPFGTLFGGLFAALNGYIFAVMACMAADTIRGM